MPIEVPPGYQPFAPPPPNGLRDTPRLTSRDRAAYLTLLCVRFLFIDVTRKAEVGDLDDFTSSNQHVSGGKVTMDELKTGTTLLHCYIQTYSAY